MNNNDIEKLDFILNKIIETNWLVTANELILGGFYKHNETKLAEQDFKVYQNIFYKYNVGELSSKEDNYWIKPNINSVTFQRNGGFFKKFQNELIKKNELLQNSLKQKEKDNLEIELANSNIRANKLNEKNSNFNKKVNVINIVIGILNILVALGLGWWSYKVGLLK